MKLPLGFVLATWALRQTIGRGRAAFAALLVLSSCRQIVGIESREDSEADAAGALLRACELPTREVDCARIAEKPELASCITRNCCLEAKQCAGDPQCSCFETCGVGDSSCRLGCSKKWDASGLPALASPIPLQADLQLCRDTSCADACDGPWDCLGHVKWKIPDLIPETIKISASAKCLNCGAIGYGPNAGVSVSVCSAADPKCAAPLQPTKQTDDDGRVDFAIKTIDYRPPLAVYLEFRKEGYLDHLLMLTTPPLSHDFDVGAVDMDQLADVERLAQNLLTQYDQTLAVVKLSVKNCNLGPASAIELRWDEPGAAKFFPSPDGGWPLFAVNLPAPPSGTRVVAHLNEGEKPIVAVVNLVVREKAVTLAPFVTPTPLPTTSGL